MEKNKHITFKFVIVNLALLVCSFILYDMGYNDGLVDALNKIQSCEMRFSNYKVSTENGIYGVYSHPDYFCVWTKDREPRDIAQTTFHELAHYYAYRDSEHFCGGDYITKKVCEED